VASMMVYARAYFLSWRKMLRNHGLDITQEQFASTFGQTNPDIFAQLYPEVFLKAARKLGLPPESCVVVDDAQARVTAGKAAGCVVIALTGTTTGAHFWALWGSGQWYVVN
jgi:beta-phosphoglucomutase-like phosphatase (HAD superfamily)